MLLTAGLVVLLFLAWQLWWTDVVANRDQARTVAALHQQWADARTPAEVGPVERGDAYAVVRIPRFGSDYAEPVYEGVDASVLERGVGHYPGSAQPGEVGNLALAGHRTTYGKPFRDIDALAVGDRVVVQTATHWYAYRVSEWRIVSPGAVEVVAPVPGRPGAPATEAMLTMTACHPVFSAAQRYVVHAVLDDTAVGDEPPSSWLDPPKEVP